MSVAAIDTAQLSLEWLGGAAERRLQKARPGYDDLPWDSIDAATIDVAHYAPVRAAWTNGVFTEHASGAAFSALALALMECNAPVDLAGAAADCAVDEMTHVALASRLVMSLGGATPFLADVSRLAPRASDERPLLRAAELAIKVSCVGEALSLPALAASHRSATRPLICAVLDRLRHDEASHAAIGHWFMAWAVDSLSPGELERLGHVASEAIAVYAPLWLNDNHDTQVLGTHGLVSYRSYMEEAVDVRIIRRLAPYGIHATRSVA